MNAFVHIVESPSSDDLLDGRTEGRLLSEALRLSEIPLWYNLATDRKALVLALSGRLTQAINFHKQFPIMHFSMHGNQQGVALTNNEFVSWEELRRLLAPVNSAMRGGLLICMSSCYGSSGFLMAANSGEEPPFWALVGHNGSASWSDAAVGYVTFYHHFFKGHPVEDCVEAMKVASGDKGFLASSGRVTRESWLAIAETLGLTEVQEAAQSGHGTGSIDS